MHAGSFHSFAPSHAGGAAHFAQNGGSAGHYGNFGGQAGNFAARNNFAGHYGSFAAHNNFAGRSSSFAARNNSWGRYGNWGGLHGNEYGHGRHDWDNYFARGGWGRGWGRYWGGYGGWGGYWPWYGGGGSYWPWWYSGWDGGYPYDYSYSYPYTGDYYYSYPSVNYDYYTPNNYDYYSYGPSVYDGSYYYPSDNYDNTDVVGQSATVIPQQPFGSSAPAPAVSPEAGSNIGTTEDHQNVPDSLQYYSEARMSFLQGDYTRALQLAQHSAVDAPNNAKVHELISLALFALHDYRRAASEAHAAMALGPIAEWNDLLTYYYDPTTQTTELQPLQIAKYTTQLRALEEGVRSHPKDAANHFLLGYHYLMIGARDNAKTQIADAVSLTPDDKLAARYLQQFKTNEPLTPREMASQRQGQTL
jgi:tetratricopeptide (TPR) repeat protein